MAVERVLFAHAHVGRFIARAHVVGGAMIASIMAKKSSTEVFVYQDVTVLPEQQAVLDAAFTMVGPKEAEEKNKEIVAIFGKPHCPRITGELLDKFPNVRVVSSHSVGYEHIDLEACKSRGVRVGNVGSTLSGTTADMAFALLLSSARKVVEGNTMARDPNWTSLDDNSLLGLEVSGMVLGIVGMGRIGLEVAKRARGFDMTVLYHNRNRKPKEIEDEVCAIYVDTLHELLGQADFVVVSATGVEENHNMFGLPEFSAMKPTGVFVNVSRGSLVNQDALVKALTEGNIAAAGLDVTQPEPLPRDHPLLSLNNVTIVPHRGRPICEIWM